MATEKYTEQEVLRKYFSYCCNNPTIAVYLRAANIPYLFLNKQKVSFSRQTYAVEILARCAQSVWPLRFVSGTKITFLGIFFVQTLQNIASIRNRNR